MLKRSSKIGVHCHQSMHQKYNTQSSNNVTSKIEPSFDPSIYEAPRIQPLHCPPSSPHFISPRNAGRIDANHIFSQQSTVGRISNRRPIDSSPGDCRQPRIHYFPLDFFEFKGHPSPFLPLYRSVSSKGEIFHGISRCRYIVSASNNALNPARERESCSLCEPPAADDSGVYIKKKKEKKFIILAFFLSPFRPNHPPSSKDRLSFPIGEGNRGRIRITPFEMGQPNSFVQLGNALFFFFFFWYINPLLKLTWEKIVGKYGGFFFPPPLFLTLCYEKNSSCFVFMGTFQGTFVGSVDWGEKS